MRYIWKKLASPNWLRINEPAIAAASNGTHAVVERPGRQRLEIEAVCKSKAAAEKLRQVLGGTVTPLRPDWLARSMRNQERKPLRIAGKLTIVSEGQPGTGRLVIPSGAAFGTGDHATTAMSLRMLEQASRKARPEWTMLDVGTGSGIFALAAAKLGAREAIGIDNDPIAVRTAQANAKLNRVRNATFSVGDARRLPRRRAVDILAANLFSELLIAALPGWRRIVGPGGALILSGILRDQERAVLRAVGVAGFAVRTVRRRGKWVAILARRELSK